MCLSKIILYHLFILVYTTRDFGPITGIKVPIRAEPKESDSQRQGSLWVFALGAGPKESVSVGFPSVCTSGCKYNIMYRVLRVYYAYWR